MNWIFNTQDWGEKTDAWMKSRMYLIYSVSTNQPLTMVAVPITRGQHIVHVFAYIAQFLYKWTYMFLKLGSSDVLECVRKMKLICNRLKFN